MLVGGADGVPQIYRAFRKTSRKIGDNANLLRRYPAMEGRIFGVAYSADGLKVAASSSLDGRGLINVYNADFDSTLSTNLIAALEIETSGQKPEQRAMIESYVTNGIRLVLSMAVPETPIYSVSFHPAGRVLAAAGADGQIRLIELESGTVSKKFSVAPLSRPPRGSRLQPSQSIAGVATMQPRLQGWIG